MGGVGELIQEECRRTRQSSVKLYQGTTQEMEKEWPKR